MQLINQATSISKSSITDVTLHQVACFIAANEQKRAYQHRDATSLVISVHRPRLFVMKLLNVYKYNVHIRHDVCAQTTLAVKNLPMYRTSLACSLLVNKILCKRPGTGAAAGSDVSPQAVW